MFRSVQRPSAASATIVCSRLVLLLEKPGAIAQRAPVLHRAQRWGCCFIETSRASAAPQWKAPVPLLMNFVGVRLPSGRGEMVGAQGIEPWTSPV
jgi:hypothetical protein